MSELSHLLIRFEDGRPCVSQLQELPDGLNYKGELLRADTKYFGDVDYLRNRNDQLIGFGWLSGDANAKNIWNDLLAESNNVRLDDGRLVILLELQSYEIEDMQAMGTRIYRGSSKKVMLAIPNWGFRELGFRLTTSDAPSKAVLPL